MNHDVIHERHIDVSTFDGNMETFVVHPAASGKYPAVILYMDVWGIREELRDIARNVAQAGYCCLLPDLYYRFGKIRNEFRNPDGRMASLRTLTPEQQEQVRGPMRRLSDQMAMDDTAALLEAMPDLDGAAQGPLGAIGYCMGGRHALFAAGTFVGRFHLAVSLHGSDLVMDRSLSPHVIAARTDAHVYCGFAELDPYAASHVMSAIDEEFRRCGVTYRSTLHRGAKHGYALPDRDVFDKEATDRDWNIIFSMLKDASLPEER